MTSGRRTYLLDGRRVSIADLIEAGHLAAGDVLTFERPRVGMSHTAIVEARGTLRVGGRSFATPSGAGRVATGGIAVDGWSAWVTDDGQSLYALRAELLEKVADEALGGATRGQPGPIDEPYAADGEDDVTSEDSALDFVPRHEFLKDARRAAEGGAPLFVPVRALLARWGGRARGPRIAKGIEADLDNHGLTTRPNFMRVSLDDDVALVLIAADIEKVINDAEVDEPDDGIGASVVVEVADKVRPEIGVTLGNLMSRERPLVSVNHAASIEQALTLMLINDFSQLPVLKTKHTCVGAVTWKSIAYAKLIDVNAPLSAAIVPASIRSYEHDLHTLLPLLKSEDFLIVTDSSNAISGIVTTADVVELYGSRTLPFLLIGELDQELRLVMELIGLDMIKKVCSAVPGGQLQSYDDMSMGHYQQVLSNPECWAQLGWPLDRTAFIGRLDELREARNDVMHFNPDGVPDGTVENLRHMLALIRTCGSLVA